MMPRCCLEHFALKGIEDNFSLARPGDLLTCPCGRTWVMRGTWQPYSLTCPLCHWVSYYTEDVLHRYCGHCHVFLDDQPPMPGVTA